MPLTWYAVLEGPAVSAGLGMLHGALRVERVPDSTATEEEEIKRLAMQRCQRPGEELVAVVEHDGQDQYNLLEKMISLGQRYQTRILADLHFGEDLNPIHL